MLAANTYVYTHTAGELLTRTLQTRNSRFKAYDAVVLRKQAPSPRGLCAPRAAEQLTKQTPCTR